MIVITVEAYKNAQVHIITVGDRKLFWVKMIDVQDRLGLKDMSDLEEKCVVFWKQKTLQKNKNKNIQSRSIK